MNILEFALQMEKDGEAYYRQIAHRTANKGLRTILTMLADEEVKHQQIVESMRQSLPSLGDSQVLTRAKNIFAEMKEANMVQPDESGQIDLYQRAQSLEAKSRDFYAEKAKDAEGSEQTALLMALSIEEDKHYCLLGNIVDFVSRPQQWLEDAEFNNMDNY
ncbi:ferritin family protein [Planctomycetota bacterium]